MPFDGTAAPYSSRSQTLGMAMDVDSKAISCPGCGGTSTIVIDSRPSITGIRRRRECLSCMSRYTTYEMSERYILAKSESDKRSVVTLLKSLIEQLENGSTGTVEELPDVRGYTRYDWSRWEDGETHTLQRGIHFSVLPQHFRVRALRHAKKNGMAVRCKAYRSGRVVLRFVKEI